MDKKAVVHIHYGTLAIKKKLFEPVLMRWMKLEPIIQSEISQEYQYSIQFIYMKFRKMVTKTLYVRWQKRHREIYRTVFWTRGRGRGWDDLGEWH